MNSAGGTDGPSANENAGGPLTPAPGRPWYRGRGLLVGAGVVVVLGITVLTDLPQHTSRSAELAGDKTVMSEVEEDVGPCSYALGESLTIFGDMRGHSLTAAQTAQVPGLLRDDQSACSFTDDSIYQLSTIEVPGSTSGKQLGDLVNTVTLWATSDALSAIEQVQTLSTDTTDASALKALSEEEMQLTKDRAQARAELAAADRLVGGSLPGVDLAPVPQSARLPSA